MLIEEGRKAREKRAALRRSERLRVVEVEASDDDSAVVTARMSYAGGTAGVVKVVVRKGDPAWLVDWPATLALWE